MSDYSLTEEDRALFEKARDVLEPIFRKMSGSQGNTPFPTLRQWDEQVSGWLPTLGRLAAMAKGEATILKVAAMRKRAEVQKGLLDAGTPVRKAENMARLDMDVVVALEAWGRARGEADVMKALREDAEQTLNGIKKVIDAEGVMRK